MNRYDARQQFIDGLEQYVVGNETDEGLSRLAKIVSGNRDRMPPDACSLIGAILLTTRFSGSYADAAQALHRRLGDGRSQAA